MTVNGVQEVNGGADRIYYELDGEGDADSSTTPSHNVDHHRDREYYISIVISQCLSFSLFLSPFLSLTSSN